ncbi:MAG: hypothetical protein ACTJGM_01765 [Fusobacterium sp.]
MTILQSIIFVINIIITIIISIIIIFKKTNNILSSAKNIYNFHWRYVG